MQNTAPDLTALFLLGFAGTGHCVGMCGPLTIAFPGRSGRFSAHVYYHAGRITTYTLIGALIGFLGGLLGSGNAKNTLLDAASAQMTFSIVAGVFLLVFALIRLELIREPRFMTAISPGRIPGVSAATRAAAESSALSMLPLGLAMGLLPCGLSFAAFARAIPTGSASTGALYLAAFGLGTLPGLLLIGTTASRFFVKHRRLSDVVSGVVMIGMGVDLLLDQLPRL